MEKNFTTSHQYLKKSIGKNRDINLFISLKPVIFNQSVFLLAEFDNKKIIPIDVHQCKIKINFLSSEELGN